MTTVPASVLTDAHCASMCSSLAVSGYTATPYTCQAYNAGQNITITGGEASVGCATTITTEVGLCRVTLSVKTSGSSSTYMEVWLPNDNTTSWNGRTMSTDNGGLNGCVHYVDMAYVSSMGFAAIGDNGGHNSSAFDGSWMLNNNEAIVDWADRGRHAATVSGKAVVKKFYGKAQNKAYYVGCSTGGAQGLHSAQYYPNDFDGIIAGSAAADFEHLQDWSGRFIELTGTNSSDARFLTLSDYLYVQSAILAQCDQALDGVNDGILEDPTICKFNATVLTCSANGNAAGCLTATQTNTVQQIFTELYNTAGQLLYPALLYGSQVDAYKLGQLDGAIPGIVNDWYRFGVYNNTNFDPTALTQTDYTTADSQDALHGHPSSWLGNLTAFHARGAKLLMYHGQADPLVSGANSQRYYLKVAKTMGMTNTALDPWLRLFRISGMAHCGVGGISGAGAWMFGQNAAADLPGVVDNVVTDLVNWVEKGSAPNVLTGTKFWYDTPAYGVQFQRSHCRFPYRTTYNGGDSTKPSGWNCTFISDWQTCAVGATPRLCNSDGTFL